MNFLKTLETARQQSEKITPLTEEIVKSVPPKQTKVTKPASQSKAPAAVQKQDNKNDLSFHTPVSPPIAEDDPLEQALSGNPNMQQFTKKLVSKLKHLKPIN